MVEGLLSCAVLCCAALRCAMLGQDEGTPACPAMQQLFYMLARFCAQKNAQHGNAASSHVCTLKLGASFRGLHLETHPAFTGPQNLTVSGPL